MDRHAVTLLQKLASKLPPEIYALVAQEIVSEFAVPQPSIAKTLQALIPAPVAPQPTRAPKPRKERTAPVARSGSVAGQIRELLRAGPRTTEEIRAALPEVPPNQIHPTLAAIGAKPVGSVVDAEGYTRKQYGYVAEPVTEISELEQPTRGDVA